MTKDPIGDWYQHKADEAVRVRKEIAEWERVLARTTANVKRIYIEKTIRQLKRELEYSLDVGD